MNKLLLVVLLLCSSHVFAQQESVKDLEAKYDEIMKGLKTLLDKIDEVEARVARLERYAVNPVKQNTREEIKREDRAELVKWRKLDGTQTMKEVTDLIGLPLEKQVFESGEVSEIWNYQSGGVITFKGDKIFRWRVPKNLRD